ncbi:hypothetical protein KVV02_007575 [Mortierella alpina]|uniref:Uncharacterized protein n=1 Tax=Mortierella alpina TaxID=64518 RepID=A0A9P8CVP6_MORAP|nr:hypothetical protein KVV02_007575 [Mortierella alpina]
MLSGRSAAERAERRAAKTQSLYVATPSSFGSNTSSSFLHQQPQQQQQQQQPHPGHGQSKSAFLTHHNDSSNNRPSKSPKKTRPFSMMLLHSQEDPARQRQEGYPAEHLQQSLHQPLNESDEDVIADGHSLSSTIEYGDSDLKDADGNTQMLIAHLTDLDSGLPILLERVKQNLHSCKDMVSFLKKRSVMEAEYGTNILKLASTLRDTYRQQPDGPDSQAHYKQGSYGDCWSHILEMHERMGNNRLEFSRDLQVVSEELSAIYKETDRSRKQFKEAGAKQERTVQEHEQSLEKAKLKYESLTEEWERAILQKAADPSAQKKTMTKGMTMSIFRQPKSMGQLHRQEEEAKTKAMAAQEQYKSQLARTNDMRQYYYTHTLPSILKNLKDTIDESDLSLQYYLMRYGYMYEDYMMKDAIVLNPINGSDLGLRDRVELINKDTDLQVFVEAYAVKAGPVAKDAAPYEEYLMSAQAQSIINPRPIFGCDLAEQLIRDEADLPEIVVKCTEAIERYGMDTQGIYRVSGITSATNRLRSAFDRAPCTAAPGDCSAVDLDSETSVGDVNSVASVLKSWFRELPEPLLTRRLYPDFIKAANIEDPALQLMNLHQVTNQLPDPNYATLKFLMCHLNRVQANQAVNKMGASNLGLIFGPTLTSTSGVAGDAVSDLADMGLQCRVIETLLNNYGAIFDIEEEEGEGHGEDQQPNEQDLEHDEHGYNHYGRGEMQPIHEEYGSYIQPPTGYSGTMAGLPEEHEEGDIGDRRYAIYGLHDPQNRGHEDSIVTENRRSTFEDDFGERVVPVMEEEAEAEEETVDESVHDDLGAQKS